MSFPTATARYIIFLLNLVFLVSALAIAAAAIITDMSFWNRNYVVEPNWLSPGIVIVIICGIISVISLFGCCGVVKESRVCLILASCLLVVFIVAEIVAGIYLYTDRDQIASKLDPTFKESMVKYNRDERVTKGWDVLQLELQCCGFNNSTDWAPILNGILPHNCCGQTIPMNRTCTPVYPDLYKIGCYAALVQKLQSYWMLVAGITIGVGVVQMLCAVASGFLARHINKQYEAV